MNSLICLHTIHITNIFFYWGIVGLVFFRMWALKFSRRGIFWTGRKFCLFPPLEKSPPPPLNWAIFQYQGRKEGAVNSIIYQGGRFHQISGGKLSLYFPGGGGGDVPSVFYEETSRQFPPPPITRHWFSFSRISWKRGSVKTANIVSK